MGRNDLREIESAMRESTSEFDQEFRSQHGQELRILRQVESNVGNMFETVMLCLGLQDAQFDLEYIFHHFKHNVTEFCAEVDKVYQRYLHVADHLSPEQGIARCLQLEGRV